MNNEFLSRANNREQCPEIYYLNYKDFYSFVLVAPNPAGYSINMPSSHRSSYSLSGAQRLGQSGDLLIEQVLGLLPHPSSSAVLQLEEAGQKSLTELFRTLTRHQRWQVVDADNAQGRALAASGESHRHGGFVEGGGNVVDGNGVVGVGTVGKDGQYPCVPGVLQMIRTCQR